MNPITARHFVSALIAVLALALGGIVLAPVPAAHAAPTAWTCTVDTFVWRTGGLNQAVVTDGIPTPTAGPPLVSATPSATMTNLNAIALHPRTGVVYANNVASPVGDNARVINPDGTVEDVSDSVSFAHAPGTAYAGGTFTPDGYWLLADASGRFATVDLTAPSSPTYGEVIHQGIIRDSAGGTPSRWLSGDMAFRDSDERIYFTTWGTTKQVGSIPRAAFFANADIVPDFGPMVTVPAGTRTSGTAMDFDSAGNLWMSTNIITTPPTVPAQQTLWRLDAATLTGADPIIPSNPVSFDTASGTDGFMCLAAAAVTPLGGGPAGGGPAGGGPAGGGPAGSGSALAETGQLVDAVPVVGGLTLLILGMGLIIFARAGRRQARSFH